MNRRNGTIVRLRQIYRMYGGHEYFVSLTNMRKKYKNLRAGTAGVTGLQLEQRKQEGDE